MTTLTAANHQWATRPADERFANLEDAITATRNYRQASVQKDIRLSEMTVAADGQDVMLQSRRTGTFAHMSHFAFGRVCNMAEAPAPFLRSLPASMASSALAYKLGELDDRGMQVLLARQGADIFCRALTSQRYARIWNHECLEELRPLVDQGWTTPPAYNIGDCVNHGLYASDHDMFAFLVNENAKVDDGTGNMLSRGFFLSNSEVGAAACKLVTYLYDYVCGNHYVWGAREIEVMNIRHVGNARFRFDQSIRRQLREYAQLTAAEDEAAIRQLRNTRIGDNRGEVVERVYRKRINGLSKVLLGNAWDAARDAANPQPSDPRTMWGLVQGITWLSQQSRYTDRRTEIDTAAGKLLALAV